tara:strand:+ start:377 stop:553 length:177 start_codon:yes stop_codon:yes gene_type:complete
MAILHNKIAIPEWDELSMSQQKEYLDKAYYLIDNGYVQNHDEETVARKIYMNEKFGKK